jgi:hypothetical protein
MPSTPCKCIGFTVKIFSILWPKSQTSKPSSLFRISLIHSIDCIQEVEPSSNLVARGEYETYLRDALPRQFRSALESSVADMQLLNQGSLTEEVVRLVEDCQERVFARFRPQITSGTNECQDIVSSSDSFPNPLSQQIEPLNFGFLSEPTQMKTNTAAPSPCYSIVNQSDGHWLTQDDPSPLATYPISYIAESIQASIESPGNLSPQTSEIPSPTCWEHETICRDFEPFCNS